MGTPRNGDIESYWEVVRPHLVVERSINSMVLLKALMKLGRREPTSTLLTDNISDTSNKVLVQGSVDPRLQPGFRLKVEHELMLVTEMSRTMVLGLLEVPSGTVNLTVQRGLERTSAVPHAKGTQATYENPMFRADLLIREYISTVFNTFGVEVQFQTIREHFEGFQTDYDFEKPYQNEEVLRRLDEISRMWPNVIQ
jgi:hypothetical protein